MQAGWDDFSLGPVSNTHTQAEQQRAEMLEICSIPTHDRRKTNEIKENGWKLRVQDTKRWNKNAWVRTSAYDYLKRFGVDSSSASSVRALFFWVARPAASGRSISRNDAPQSRPSARRSMSCIATALQNVSTLIHLWFFICSNQNTLVTINPMLELIPKLPSCCLLYTSPSPRD